MCEEQTPGDCSQCSTILEVAVEFGKEAILDVSNPDDMIEFCHFVSRMTLTKSLMGMSKGENQNLYDDTEEHTESVDECGAEGECKGNVRIYHNCALLLQLLSQS